MYISFIVIIIILFLGPVDSLFCQYCEKFLELITDLIVSFALLSSLCTHFSLLHVVSAINKKVFSDTA